MERWSHFDYTSGSNPYIAKTDKEAERIIRKYERLGIKVEELPYSSRELYIRLYIVHDKEGRHDR